MCKLHRNWINKKCRVIASSSMLAKFTRLTSISCLIILFMSFAVSHPLDNRLLEDDVYPFKQNQDDNVDRENTNNKPLLPPIAMSKLPMENETPFSVGNNLNSENTKNKPLVPPLSMSGLPIEKDPSFSEDDNVDRENTNNKPLLPPIAMSKLPMENETPFSVDNNLNSENTKNKPLVPPLSMSGLPIEKDPSFSEDHHNGKSVTNTIPRSTDTLQLLIEGDIAIAGLNSNNRDELMMRMKRQKNPLYKRDSAWIWNKHHLTWRLYNLPSAHSPITASQVVSDIQTAFSIWSSVTPLTFERYYTGDNADIRISFASKDHGDGFSFDDRLGVAGHAFTPGSGRTIDGDIHLDDDEIFTDDGSYGTNFLFVFTHELGHALGLFHSTDRTSIMQSWAMPALPYGTKLPLTDARSITDLYGMKPGMTTLPSDPPPTVAPTIPPDFNCRGEDYAASVIRGSLFLFQNDRYWRFDGDSVKSSLVTPANGDSIQPYFKNLPADIESAVTFYNGTTVYMKGKFWYSYNTRRPFLTQKGYPRNTDAAYHDVENQVTYFFKGKLMLKLYHETNESSNWISTSTEFEGLPNYLSAAFTDEEGNRFFMKNNKYWKYKRTKKTAERGYPKLLPASIC